MKGVATWWLECKTQILMACVRKGVLDPIWVRTDLNERFLAYTLAMAVGVTAYSLKPTLSLWYRNVRVVLKPLLNRLKSERCRASGIGLPTSGSFTYVSYVC